MLLQLLLLKLSNLPAACADVFVPHKITAITTVGNRSSFCIRISRSRGIKYAIPAARAYHELNLVGMFSVTNPEMILTQAR